MSFLGTRNAVSIGVSPHVTLGGSNLLGRLSPSLLLNFAGAQTLDPRITFTRASTATFTGSNGLIQTAAINAPRFDYNPTTLAPLGLLIEEQRTNLVTYSEQFDNAAWVKGGSSITANTIVAPDGTLSGDKLVEDTSTGFHTIGQNATVVSGQTYALSVYLKAGERTEVQILGRFSGAWVARPSVLVNLASGTISGSAGAAPATITAVGNGWYRVTIVGTTNTTSAGFQVDIRSGNTSTYQGDGFSGIYIWGAQLEAGAFPTSYIPTVASQVTRSADVAVMTGTNFSSWYNASVGTFFAEYQGPAVLNNSGGSTVNGVVMATNPTNTNLSAIFLHPSLLGKGSQNMLENSVNPGRLDAGGAYSTAVAKAAAVFATSDRAISVNGGVAVTSATGTAPTGVDRLHLGWQSIVVGTNMLNGTIRKIAYYPRRLANSQLQAITD